VERREKLPIRQGCNGRIEAAMAENPDDEYEELLSILSLCRAGKWRDDAEGGPPAIVFAARLLKRVALTSRSCLLRPGPDSVRVYFPATASIEAF